MRPSRVEVDLDAIAHNLEVVAGVVAPAGVWAVVKADGYGHGAVEVARAAVAAGAHGVAVALVQEGVELREAGIAVPVLVLSEPPVPALADAVGHLLTLTVMTPRGVDAVAAEARRQGVAPLPVHLKVDTGMNRVGVLAADALGLARRVVDTEVLELEGVFTHLARADEPEASTTDEQLDLFDDVVAQLHAEGIVPRILHAANSAGALAHPRSRYDMVRVGIALYGIPPAAGLPAVDRLRPAMSVLSEVSFVKGVPPGAGVSYGHHWIAPRPSTIATVPIGYADGVDRRLGVAGGQALVDGYRRPIVGVVTMDQLLLDCSEGSPVLIGDEVVLLGRQGDHEITAVEWAERLDTIGYEVVCGFGPRLPRVYRGEGIATADASPSTLAGPEGEGTEG